MNRSGRNPLPLLFLFVPWLVFFGLTLPASMALAQDLGETDEVVWSLPEEPDLLAKATELATPVAMYEFVRNQVAYIPYHGARSSSVNSFLGRIGNDVDISSTLIAMLRSQGIRARYAVATVKIPAQEMMDWLGVRDVDLAASILDDQGVQNVAVVGGGTHVELEHVWVQAFVPLDSYRAAGPAAATDCVAAPAGCAWIDLAPAFKLHAMKDPAEVIDIYGVVQFDYDAYYNALNETYPPPADGIERKGKNPLEIYEEQILAHLQSTAPGRTLEDVMDTGPIVRTQSRVLPESLPFELVSPLEVYDNVDAHDAVAVKAWEKRVEVTAVFDGGIYLSAGGASLAELSTQRLTLSYQTSGTSASQQLRLGGVVKWSFPAGPNVTFNGTPVTIGRPFDLELSLDGPPDTTGSGTDTVYQVTYPNLQIGGYYAISTGGETSNWSQVHRAARQLLAANEQYPIVLDASSVPHVDENGDGTWDAGDTPLLDHADAMDSLTGGLLYTAQSLYYARLREASERFGALNHVRSPIGGYLGVVSSTYGVEYLDETAYAVMPDGLLIDMKGIQYNGNWRIDAPGTTAPEHFELFGHVGSSLEHEIWQEITGFDALSTVRGIQFAVGAGADLIDARKNPSEDTLPAAYPDLGFTTSPPPSWTRDATNIFATRPNTYSSASGVEVLEMFKGVVDLADPSLRLSTLTYDSSGYYEENIAYFDDVEEQIKALPSSGSYTLNLPGICGGGSVSGSRSTLLAAWSDCYDTYAALEGNFFVYLDENQGFVPPEYVHRDAAVTVDYPDVSFVRSIRNDLYLRDVGSQWVEYVLPSRKPVGPFFLFNVYLRKQYDTATGALLSQTYAIQNQSNLVASGGWVNGEEALVQTNTAVFDNEFFNDENLVKATNNDLIKTPSTSDPVSTVTGNMYLDETDVTIGGRGLHLAFTRTYNSGSAKSATAGGPLSPGWTHSYAMKLVSNDFGRNPNADATAEPDNFNGKTSSITYTDERGGDVNYLVDDSGGSPSYAITPPTGVFDTLALDTPSSGMATLTFRNGVGYVFDAQGADLRNPGVSARLSAIEDPYGNQLDFTYDAQGRLVNVDDQLPIAGRTGLTFTYDANDQIQTVSDWVRTWTYGYDADQNLATVTNPLGDAVTYRYADVAGVPGTKLLVEVIEPEDRDGSGEGDVRTTFTYYENARAFSNANAYGQGEKLDYNLFRKGTRVTGPRGFNRQYYYDEKGLLTKLEEPDGAVLTFAHNADNLRTRKVDGLGYPTDYSYFPGTGLLAQERDALFDTIDYTYGPFDKPAQITDKRNNVQRRIYFSTTDPVTGALYGMEGRREVRLGGVDEVLRRTRYRDGGNVWYDTVYFDDAETISRTTTRTFDPTDTYVTHEETVVDGVTIAKDYTYDTLGRRLTQTVYRRTSPTDPTALALTTTYGYDDLDRVVSTTDPLGNIQEIDYDKNGNVVEERIRYKTGPGTYDTRVVARYEYDDADRLVRQFDAYDEVTTYAYDEAGNLVQRTDPNGHSIHYGYDPMGRRTVVQDENGHRVETVYDLAGRKSKTIDGNGGVVRYAYDEVGRLTSVTDAMGFVHQYQYDENGNVTGEIDANQAPLNAYGVTIHREFDGLDRLVRVVNAENEQTLYEYDLQGNRTKITDAEGRVTRFVYDTLGRRKEVIDPLVEPGGDKTKTFTYDEVGNLITQTDRNGETTHFTYDELDRLVQVDHLADGTSQTFTYDVYGDLVAVSNGDVTYTYTYDLEHRMLSQTDSRLGLSLLYEYDAAGNFVRKTDYQGEVTTFTYDSSNRLVEMKNPGYVQVSYHYDPAGRLLNRILSNGSQTDYEYDANHRLTRLVHKDATGAVLSDTAHTHDNVGNVKTRTDASGQTVYGYDGVFRLVSADAPGSADDRSYTYDRVGNRKSMTTATQGYFYAHDVANRLTTVRTGSAGGPILYQYVYDDNGSLTEKQDAAGNPLLTFAYDQRRQVESISIDGGAATNSFEYDHAGYRIEVLDSRGTRRNLLEGEHLEAVYDGTGALRGSYLRGVIVDETVNGYEIDAAGAATNLTFHHDRLQSVTALGGHAGGTVQTIRYSPFGEVLGSTGSSTNALRYTGRPYDPDTGLYYYRARYYDPFLGRFLTEDPLGFEAGINFYAYVGNNPLRFNDPMGEELVGITGGITVPFTPGPVAGQFTLSGSLVIDRNFNIDFVVTPEVGVGVGSTGIIPGSAFLRGVASFDPDVTVESLQGFAPSATVDALLLSGSTTFIPGVGRVYEGGITTPSISVSGSLGYGLSTADAIGGLGNLFTPESVPESSMNSFSNPGSSGGFVLYPNRPNTNQLFADVYAK